MLEKNLTKKGYPMFFIHFEKREQYYQAIEKADKNDNKSYIAEMLDLIIVQIRSYGHKEKQTEI